MRLAALDDHDFPAMFAFGLFGYGVMVRLEAGVVFALDDHAGGLGMPVDGGSDVVGERLADTDAAILFEPATSPM